MIIISFNVPFKQKTLKINVEKGRRQERTEEIQEMTREETKNKNIGEHDYLKNVYHNNASYRTQRKDQNHQKHHYNE